MSTLARPWIVTLAAAAFAVAADPAPADLDPRILEPLPAFTPDMIVTPTSVTDGAGNPIAGAPSVRTLVWALKNTGDPASGWKGRKILLRAGDYPPFWFDSGGASSSAKVHRLGGTLAKPVVVRGEPGATIKREAAGGHTIVVLGKHTAHSLHHITWQNVRFEATAGGAALHIGSNTDAANGISYNNWRFLRCEIDGRFDWYSNTGPNGPNDKSKWGFLTYALRNFSFSGGWIHDIGLEHAIYMHNNLGNVTVNDNLVERCGRTFMQIVARTNEFGGPALPPNPGNITVRRNLVKDVTIGDGCEGGAGFTQTGRNDGMTTFMDNVMLFGFDRLLRESMTTRPPAQGGCVSEPDGSRPFANVAFTTWTTSTENYDNSGTLVMLNNIFAFAANSGRGSAVNVYAMDQAWIEDNTIWVTAQHNALVVGNGVQTGSNPHPIPPAYLVKNNQIYHGDLRLSGVGAGQDYCIAGNVIANGPSSQVYVNGAPAAQPMCQDLGCDYCP
jgi:hypothetical protein